MGIQLGCEVGDPRRESLEGPASQGGLLPEPSERPSKLRLDVLRIAERAVAFADADRSRPTGPWINILEDMSMNGFVVPDAEPAERRRLIEASAGGSLFEAVESSLRTKIRQVSEDAGARIARRIDGGVVHSRRRLLLAVLREDETTSFVRRKMVGAGGHDVALHGT